MATSGHAALTAACDTGLTRYRYGQTEVLLVARGTRAGSVNDEGGVATADDDQYTGDTYAVKTSAWPLDIP